MDNLSLILMLAAGVCFILQGIIPDRFTIKWWAIGVAFYLFAQVA